jgi:hypothetical protein
MKFRNKLVCLLLESFSSRIKCLWISLGAYLRVEPLKGASLELTLALLENNILGWKGLLSSLLQNFISYGEKLYNIDHRAQCYKTLYIRTLLIFVLN